MTGVCPLRPTWPTKDPPRTLIWWTIADTGSGSIRRLTGSHGEPRGLNPTDCLATAHRNFNVAGRLAFCNRYIAISNLRRNHTDSDIYRQQVRPMLSSPNFFISDHTWCPPKLDRILRVCEGTQNGLQSDAGQQLLTPLLHSDQRGVKKAENAH
jgi:hypothetical protein